MVKLEANGDEIGDGKESIGEKKGTNSNKVELGDTEPPSKSDPNP